MFHILTDTSANLPTRYLRKHDIGVIPIYYMIDGEEFACLDTDAFDGKSYYENIRKGTRVTTSQINPLQYMEFFEPYLAAGEDIVFIAMSSGISSSYLSALSAAENLKQQYPAGKILVIDSLGASLGQGLLVAAAVQQKERGKTAEETAGYIQMLRQRMYQVFTVDDLTHLRRTGRCSNISAAVGTVLQIKPLLKGNEKGQIVTFDKVRGRKRSVEALAEKYDELAIDPGEHTVGIAHADCPKEAQYLISLLKRNRPPKKIMTVCYEPVTGSHVGPGTLALFFFGGPDVRRH